jgi:acetoin:2,6-dichlorophenolindophenol oxidoreductase subunit alpha
MAESNAPKPDGAALVDIYSRMLRVERNDDAIRTAIRRGRITAPYYSARGQEVIPAAIAHLLTKEDQICTIYRGIQDMVAKDMPLNPLWAEIMGKVDGTCKGKGGPMHLTYPRVVDADCQWAGLGGFARRIDARGGRLFRRWRVKHWRLS